MDYAARVGKTGLDVLNSPLDLAGGPIEATAGRISEKGGRPEERETVGDLGATLLPFAGEFKALGMVPGRRL